MMHQIPDSNAGSSRGIFYMKKDYDWNAIFIIIILLLGVIFNVMIEVCKLKTPSVQTVWTAILVIITAYYAFTNHRMLRIQTRAEKLKYFQQIKLEIAPNYRYISVEEGFKIELLECVFTNISNGLAYASTVKIFKGDSIVEIITEAGHTIEKEIGILPPNVDIKHLFHLKDKINFNGNSLKLRLILKTTNPLKIENTLFYLLEFQSYERDKLRCFVSLLDFDDGINKPDLKMVRDKSV